MARRLNASSASKGACVSDFVKPSDSTNSLTAPGATPLLLMPSMVGSRGSSYQGIFPDSTRGPMSLLETGMSAKASRENAPIRGARMPSAPSMERYSSSRSSYSFDLSACVTPSRLSSTAMARS